MDSVPRLSTRFNQRGVIARNVNWLGANLSRAREGTRARCRGTGPSVCSRRLWQQTSVSLRELQIYIRYS